MVISETVMSTDHKTQKESYTKRSADFIYFFYLFIYLFIYLFYFFFFFFCFQNVSCIVAVLVCCICTRREMFMRIYLRVCACMRAYVYKGCCNINDTGAGRSGREITAKSDAKIV